MGSRVCTIDLMASQISNATSDTRNECYIIKIVIVLYSPLTEATLLLLQQSRISMIKNQRFFICTGATKKSLGSKFYDSDVGKLYQW